MATKSAVRCTARKWDKFGNPTVRRVIVREGIAVDARTTLTFFAGNQHFEAWHVLDYQGNRLYVTFSGRSGSRWFYWDESKWQTWRSERNCPVLESATGIIPRLQVQSAPAPEPVPAEPQTPPTPPVAASAADEVPPGEGNLPVPAEPPATPAEPAADDSRRPDATG